MSPATRKVTPKVIDVVVRPSTYALDDRAPIYVRTRPGSGLVCASIYVRTTDATVDPNPWNHGDTPRRPIM